MAASQPVSFDPGLTQQYDGALLRSINKDGSFNIVRSGTTNVIGSIYHRLVTMTWLQFLTSVAGAYLTVNVMFAFLYWNLGANVLHTAERDLGLGGFARCFFFSVQTLTTVGYGSIYPYGLNANVVAALEAAMGVMGFALATGLLYGRFSRPSARMVFSQSMIVAPFRDGQSLQCRVANERSNILMEVEADMVLMTVERDASGQLKRNFAELKMERRNIYFLALTWTLVHPIDETSPFFGKNPEDLQRLQAEVLVLLKGFDDSFSQVVHSRRSYRWDEMQWSARFTPAFSVSPQGHMVLDLTKVSDTKPA